ncbi:hypothetical protein ACTXGQ_04265 [Marinobacter sp. 1Y8]
MPNDQSWSLDGALANPDVAIEVVLSAGGPGVPVMGTPTTTSSSITGVVTNANGATSYQTRVDGGTPINGLTASGLDDETEYSVEWLGYDGSQYSDWTTAVDVSTEAVSEYGALDITPLDEDVLQGSRVRLDTDGTYDFGPSYTGGVAAWAMGGDWRVDGVADDYVDGLAHNATVDPAAQSVFADIGDSLNDTPIFKKDTAIKRHARLSNSFRSDGTPDTRMFMFTNPMGRLEDQPYKRYQMISWRTKYTAQHGRGYKRHTLTAAPTGTFTAGDGFGFGEDCTVTSPDTLSTDTIRFQHYDPSTKEIFFWWEGSFGSTFNGWSIVGNESGVTATFLASPAGSDASNSNLKELRFSQPSNEFRGSGSMAGFNSNVSHLTNYADGSGTPLDYLSPGWTTGERGDVEVDGWYHNRILLDREEGIYRLCLNGATRYITQDFETWSDAERGFVMLVGMEDDGNVRFQAWVNEIYANDSLFSVYLSDSPTAEGVDWAEVEYQHINSVSTVTGGQQSEVEINRGAYADEDDLYLYIVTDVTGAIQNLTGIALEI